MAGRSNHEIDILNGSIIDKYFRFIIPLAAGNILQLLFNAADIVVIGRFAGASELAAVGSTTAIVNLYIYLYMGIGTGANIVVAKAYATGNSRRVSRSVHSVMGLSVLCSAAMVLFGYATVGPLLVATKTPDDIIEMSKTYLNIYCLGIPGALVYNNAAAILRSIGDTKRPMIYLMISGVTNVILNLVTVVCFGMGVSGVATATTVSNYISAALTVAALMREDSSLKLELRKICLDKAMTAEILRIAVPVSMQNCMYAIPNLLIQSSVNSFGSFYVAGNSTSQNLEGFQIAFLQANCNAAVTFTSQHVSARKFSRCDRVVRTILIGSALMSVVVGITFMLLRYQLLGLYNTDPEIIAIGIRRLRIVVLTEFLDALASSMSNVLRAYGKNIQPVVMLLICVCVFRMIWLMFVFPVFRYYEMVIVTWPLSWVLALLSQGIYYMHIRKRYPKEDAAAAL